ncbi:unnamed protein product [Owenia fusiformis]|uniref:Peptidase M14 domain-containing protein n=1 Tax=Owenia fusiformis TaxID=6347 RepID=A0A8J1XVD2_OWEFU|nr:unnamed protein product [Owenia fusiformis]
MSWKYKKQEKEEPAFEYDMNPYDSFMRKHLQHYGYYTGRNEGYRIEEWERTNGYNYGPNKDDSDMESDDSNDEDDDDDDSSKDEKQRTTQISYAPQGGRMVPKLREPRQLYAVCGGEEAYHALTRWPAEIQVLPEPIEFLKNPISLGQEPMYKPTGKETTPMIRGENGGGRLVYFYEPSAGSFFLRSRVGGHRNGCADNVAVQLQNQEDKTLIFEARFESGNLLKAVQISDFEYELTLRNDLYTSKHTQWFYFRVANTRANCKYRFTITNLMKPDSLYNNGMRPVLYSERLAAEKQIGWKRCGSDIKYYKNNIKTDTGKGERSFYSLTWTVQLPYNKDKVYFAHCYPYTYTDLQHYLRDVANDPVKTKICKQRVLCRTLAGNMVYVLTITSPSPSNKDQKHKKGVVITARVHPGETNASWMMKGFLDCLLGNTADAKLLRDTFVFKIVPMLNPDGVIVGNYRCSLSGRDLNRNYKTALKDSFPSVWHTKAMVRKLLEERHVVTYCDLHGHSRKQNVFIYGCENRANPMKKLRERILPVMLNRNASDKFCYESCKFKVQKSKEGTGRVVMWNMGIMNSYTMEATFCGSTMGKKKGYHFHSSDLEMMGYHFLDTLLDYCDPDASKITAIYNELEDRLRHEILARLEKTKAGETTDLSSINLEEIDLMDADFSSDLESSTGGSDSSVSDGLPVHLQYLADKFPKKKKLRSKKDRDKQRKKLSAAPGGEEMGDKKPSSAQPQSSTKQRVQKSVSSAGRMKPKGGATGVGMPMFVQQRMEKREAEKQSDYLESLTSAFLRSGLLLSDPQKAVPHFRYSNTFQANGVRSTPAFPVDVGTLCPNHAKTFAAKYMANHLRNAIVFNEKLQEISGLPVSVNWQCFPAPGGGQRGRNVTLSSIDKLNKEVLVSKLVELTREDEPTPDLPRYRYSGRNLADSVPMTPPMPSSQLPRHLVEGPDTTSNYPRPEVPASETDLQDPIIDKDKQVRQHPLPFDQTLERDRPHDYVKRADVNINNNNLNSLDKNETASANNNDNVGPQVRTLKGGQRANSATSSARSKSPKGSKSVESLGALVETERGPTLGTTLHTQRKVNFEPDIHDNIPQLRQKHETFLPRSSSTNSMHSMASKRTHNWPQIDNYENTNKTQSAKTSRSNKPQLFAQDNLVYAPNNSVFAQSNPQHMYVGKNSQVYAQQNSQMFAQQNPLVYSPNRQGMKMRHSVPAGSSAQQKAPQVRILDRMVQQVGEEVDTLTAELNQQVERERMRSTQNAPNRPAQPFQRQTLEKYANNNLPIEIYGNKVINQGQYEVEENTLSPPILAEVSDMQQASRPFSNTRKESAKPPARISLVMNNGHKAKTKVSHRPPARPVLMRSANGKRQH